MSGWAEEYCVAGSETAGCVGCRVDEAEVGFDLGDAGGEALALEVADEEFAEECSRYDLGGAGVEAASELAGLWMCSPILCVFFDDYILSSSPVRFALGMERWPPSKMWVQRVRMSLMTSMVLFMGTPSPGYFLAQNLVRKRLGSGLLYVVSLRGPPVPEVS